MARLKRLDGRAITAAGVVSLVTLITTFSYASLYASGPLAAYLPIATASALITTAVTAIVTARWNSLPFAITAPAASASSVIGAALLAVTAQAHSDASLAADVAITLVLSAVLSGAVLFTLGRLRLGRTIRYVPYPVIAGFFAATGYLLIAGSVRMAGPGWPLVAAAIVTALLYVLTVRWKSPYVMPLVVVGGIIVTHVVLLLTRTPLETARGARWLYHAFPAAAPPIVTPVVLAHVDWGSVTGEAAGFAVIITVIVLMSLFSGAALEMESGEDADLDRDLTVAGIANVAAGVCGGFGCNLVLGASGLNYRLAGNSRIPGLVVGLVALAALAGGNRLVAYLPVPVFAAVVAFLGVRFIMQHLVGNLRTLKPTDVGIVVGMVACTIVFGSRMALLVGLIAACVVFVAACSRYRILRHELTAQTTRSRVERTPFERALLDRNGDRIRILRLQGHLFFGSANVLYETVRSRIRADRCDALVLDFHFVGGIDASAAFSFQKLARDAKAAGVTLALAGVVPSFADELRRRISLGADGTGFYPDLDRALEACEERMLQRLAPAAERRAGERRWFREALQSDAHGEKLASYLETRTLFEGNVLFSVGDAPDAMYFVREGRLSVTLDGIHVRTLLSGSLVGEMGFYTGEPRSATVVALGAVIVERLPVSALAAMEKEDASLLAAFHHMIVRLQADRLRSANAEVAALQA